ncbi:Asp23/Gls24 family envelope stress response protein [Rhodococcus sp. G-MC3]|uniref:Asp23/Gls24 family envelope stress response protein n=1 Tax=Rhodococcus sp. G-MC3 TaxID=3046209 RepID=UPI0024B96F2D|nr:Asp23/Gls24 family envelope stress response protein [Rhodococcus sp. G-MC3]MDJ0393666.1 Asp23/Gls24 family envelope stress response protein [Rhodococcus sp. G-MC3]
MTDNVTDTERGTLEVRSQVVIRMAEIAAAHVAGVERVTGGIASRSLPRVDATIRSGRIHATVEAATTWPTPIADVAVRLRSAVERDLAENSGLVVESVDVRVQYSAPEPRNTRSRPTRSRHTRSRPTRPRRVE